MLRNTPQPVQPRANAAVTTTARMTETLNRLEKREMFLSKKIEHEIKMAKLKMKKKDKRGALVHLKRKKMYDKEIQKLSGAQMTLQQQIFNIQGAQTNIDTVNAMKSGADVMKNMTAAVNVDKVEDLRDDIEEQQQLQEEISNVIGQPMGAVYDDDELEAELEGLEAEDLENDLVGLSAPTSVPAVAGKAAFQDALNLPTAPTGVVADDDDAALRELEAEFA